MVLKNLHRKGKEREKEKETLNLWVLDDGEMRWVGEKIFLHAYFSFFLCLYEGRPLCNTSPVKSFLKAG